jgi:hypothetical protein
MACKGAIERGVMVDAIFCGAAAAPDAEGWRQVARLADGHFANIDQQNGTIVVATPFDEALAKLSASINGTYLPYGAQGAWSCENQQRQDANAAGASSGAAAGRAASKASFNYRNGHWDLVDATADKEFDLSKVEDEDLPEDLRKLSVEERRKVIEGKRAERAKIQGEIAELSKKRQAFLDKAVKEAGGSADAAFDTAVRRAIREQARSKGFTFSDK